MARRNVPTTSIGCWPGSRGPCAKRGDPDQTDSQDGKDHEVQQGILDYGLRHDMDPWHRVASNEDLPEHVRRGERSPGRAIHDEIPHRRDDRTDYARQ